MASCVEIFHFKMYCFLIKLLKAINFHNTFILMLYEFWLYLNSF